VNSSTPKMTKNRLILTDEGGGCWTYEIHQAKSQMNLTGLEMMKEFKKEINHIIELMQKEAKNG
jgi:hypothetical protein